MGTQYATCGRWKQRRMIGQQETDKCFSDDFRIARHSPITELPLRVFRNQLSDRVGAANREGLGEHLC